MNLLKNIVLFCIICILLSGCSGEVLKFRNILEADQYIRNNIQTLDWNTFNQLLTEDSNVNEQDYQVLREIPFKEISTSHVVVENKKLYRFSQEKELLYVSQWEENDGEYKLTSVDFINKKAKRAD